MAATRRGQTTAGWRFAFFPPLLFYSFSIITCPPSSSNAFASSMTHCSTSFALPPFPSLAKHFPTPGFRFRHLRACRRASGSGLQLAATPSSPLGGVSCKPTAIGGGARAESRALSLGCHFLVARADEKTVSGQKANRCRTPPNGEWRRPGNVGHRSRG